VFFVLIEMRRSKRENIRVDTRRRDFSDGGHYAWNMMVVVISEGHFVQ